MTDFRATWSLDHENDVNQFMYRHFCSMSMVTWQGSSPIQIVHSPGAQVAVRNYKAVQLYTYGPQALASARSYDNNSASSRSTAF